MKKSVEELENFLALLEERDVNPEPVLALLSERDALVAENGTLRTDRTNLIAHMRHYLTEWGVPQGDENERSWLTFAVNHLGGLIHTLRLVSDDRDAIRAERDALAARVAGLEAAVETARAWLLNQSSLSSMDLWAILEATLAPAPPAPEGQK
jgi:hypothetical protein